MTIPLSAELIIFSGSTAWALVWGFHQIVVKQEFKRVDKEVENLDQKIQNNAQNLAEIKGKLIDTKISLAKIEENSKFMYESVKDMRNEVKKDIFHLYEKIEALLKKN